MAFGQYWRAIFEIWSNYRFAVNIAEIVSKINSYVRFGAILTLSWVSWLYSHDCKMKLIETPKVQTPWRSSHPRKWAGYQQAEISGSITYILYIQRVRRVRLSFLTLRPCHWENHWAGMTRGYPCSLFVSHFDCPYGRAAIPELSTAKAHLKGREWFLDLPPGNGAPHNLRHL